MASSNPSASSLALLPWLSVGLLVIASNSRIASARALPNPNVIDHVHDALFPMPNTTGGPLNEIQCYALPYGAIGIISHLLTYWTIAWMAVGKCPLWPFYPMTTYTLDMGLAVLTLCTCIPIASVTIHRCRLSWHFVLIAIWKLVTSVSLACITLHRCLIVRRVKLQNSNRGVHEPVHNDDLNYPGPDSSYGATAPKPSWSLFSSTPGRSNKDLRPLWWLLLYLAGTVVGMIGLCSLIYTSFRHNSTVRSLTYGFAAPVIIIPILVVVWWYVKHLEADGGGRVLLSMYAKTTGGAIIAFTAAFGFFSALYSDLVLGAIAENLMGLPSQDFAALYWIWFIAKRFPLLSF